MNQLKLLTMRRDNLSFHFVCPVRLSFVFVSLSVNLAFYRSFLCLSVSLSFYRSFYLSFYRSFICLSNLPVCLCFIHTFVCLSVFLWFVCLFVQSVCLSVCLSIIRSFVCPVCLSVCLSFYYSFVCLSDAKSVQECAMGCDAAGPFDTFNCHLKTPKNKIDIWKHRKIRSTFKNTEK